MGWDGVEWLQMGWKVGGSVEFGGVVGAGIKEGEGGEKKRRVGGVGMALATYLFSAFCILLIHYPFL